MTKNPFWIVTEQMMVGMGIILLVLVFFGGPTMLFVGLYILTVLILGFGACVQQFLIPCKGVVYTHTWTRKTENTDTGKILLEEIKSYKITYPWFVPNIVAYGISMMISAVHVLIYRW
jgi:hypothetical protein